MSGQGRTIRNGGSQIRCWSCMRDDSLLRSIKAGHIIRGYSLGVCLMNVVLSEDPGVQLVAVTGSQLWWYARPRKGRNCLPDSTACWIWGSHYLWSIYRQACLRGKKTASPYQIHGPKRKEQDTVGWNHHSVSLQGNLVNVIFLKRGAGEIHVWFTPAGFRIKAKNLETGVRIPILLWLCVLQPPKHLRRKKRQRSRLLPS